MSTAIVPQGYIPGSQPIKPIKWEQYARLRAQALPPATVWRRIGHKVKVDRHADANARQLERKPKVKERIAYLVKQAEERIAEKRIRIEESLWAIHEADPLDYFESYDAPARDHTGQPTDEMTKRQRPKLLEDIDPAARKLIEHMVPDGRGRYVPQLYSKDKANKELRNMLALDKQATQRDITQLSDQELIATLAAQAKELGIEIDLNYRFAQAQSAEPKAATQSGRILRQGIDQDDMPDDATGLGTSIK